MLVNSLAAATCTHNLNQSTDSLLCQDTALLTEVFQLTYQYYAKSSFLDGQAFIGFLRFLVESIDQICQQNPQLSPDYYACQLQFSHGIKHNFWQDSKTANSFFQAVACLVQYGIESFCACQYPEGYVRFLYNLELIFNNENRVIQLIQHTIQKNKMVFGVCLGVELIGEALGGKTTRSPAICLVQKHRIS